MVLRLITIFIFSLLVIGSSFAQSQGVSYHKGRIYDALASASQQKKLLLVEFLSPKNYRSNWMNKMINSSPKVLQKISDDFIAFQIDTKTKEGAGFAVTYSVTNYPTIIIFNQNGDAISKIEKNMDPDEFVDKLDLILFNTDGAAVWRIQQILSAAENMRLDEIPTLFENLEARFDDRLTEKHFWPIFRNNTITYYFSPSFGYLVENIKAFIKNIGEQEVNNALQDKLHSAVMAILTSGNAIDSLIVNDLNAIVDSTISDENELYSLTFAMIRNRIDNDAGHYLINYSKLRNLLAEDIGVSLALSLGFVADIGTREQKLRAKRLIEQEKLMTSVPSQLQMLQNLMERF